MRQAITTKFMGPTDFHGSRVKAYAQAGTVTLEWKSELDADDNHRAAAHTLANRFNWLDDGSRLVGGGLAHQNNHAVAWVMVGKNE